MAGYWQKLLDQVQACSQPSWAWKLASFVGSWTANVLLVLLLAIYVLTDPARQIVNEDVLYKQTLSVTFYDRDNNVIGHRGMRLDDSKQLKDYPLYLLQAVLSIEDRRFYKHWGIDPVGIARALHNNLRGNHVQGASTITQQLAKNLFLSSERSLTRKISEAYIALWLEARFSKDEIFKMYLDRAYMGGGVSGATEAAKYYFNKELADISISEAAALASMFKAPNKYNPELNPGNNAERRELVLSAMVEQGYITELDKMIATEYVPYIHRHRQHFVSDWYLDHSYTEVQRMWRQGLFGTNRVLQVYTGLDPKVQQVAEQTVINMLDREGDRYGVEQAGAVVMDMQGLVIAIVGGYDYEESRFNRATQALRQPGSSFKPYVYAAAINAGLLDKDSIVVDKPVCIGRWCPHNYGGKFGGAVPAWSAMAHSYNSIPVQLSIQLGNPYGSVKSGRARIVDMARSMGVTTELYDSQSLPIGSVELTIMDQATGYTSLANGGYRVVNHTITRVENSSGQVIYQHVHVPDRTLSDRVVNNLNFMMNKVVEAGTGTAARIPNQIIAGKTGTSNNYRDAWFVGYTGKYTTAVWYGNDDNSPSNNMTGGSLPARTWHDIMVVALADQPPVAPAGLNLPPVPKTTVATNRNNKAAPAARVATVEERPYTEPESSPSGIGQFFRKLFGAD